ncbi:SDR family oxidoreductase [Paralcaligenes sp. KSB-10]|uniref:SDR family oxidoreductase n=1 Tax=Paralcaligenes sp. KSB-10 TaxID=2901142 RepID=UPI001E348013|nr:SDR family oxidoreductase [Paralcaligenes sp. KSB-10]UHL64555.1 SDR family oxidoreductase [Paralcaligenes sp. KSB-10]
MSLSTVAIISGASKGLGQALALGLMKPDTQIITLARNHHAALAQRASETGCSLQQIQVDLASPSAAEHCAEQVMNGLAAGAQRYLLINNAGTVEPILPASSLNSAAGITAAFNLNVTSVMLLTAAFLRATAASKAERRILNISSGAGRNATPGWGVYCATKAALDRYSQVLAVEEADSARIVSLAPGVIDTGMQERIRASDPKDFPNLSRFVDMHEQGQLASPAAVAAKILQYIDRDDFGATVLDDIRNYA